MLVKIVTVEVESTLLKKSVVRQLDRIYPQSRADMLSIVPLGRIDGSVFGRNEPDMLLVRVEGKDVLGLVQQTYWPPYFHGTPLAWSSQPKLIIL